MKECLPDNAISGPGDIVGCGTYEWRIPENTVIWSPGLRELYGLNNAPATEAGFIELIHPDDRVRVEAETSAFIEQGDQYEHEFRIIRPDGEIRHIHDRGTVERLEDGTASVFRGLNIDVTKSRLAQGQREPSDPFSQLLERSPFGIYAVDADFRLVQVSAGAQNVFSRVRPLIGRDFAEVLRLIWPEPFATEAIGRFRHTLATGEPYHSPSTVERRNDIDQTESYDWKIESMILPDGRPGAICYFYDLSERLERETALIESERRLQLAYDAAGMGAWDLDLKHGTAVWSPQLYDLLAIDPTVPASADLFLDHIHPDDRQRVTEALDETIRKNVGLEAVFRVRRADGKERHVEGRGRVVEWADGEPLRMIGVNFDVTERHQLRQKLLDSEQLLRLVLDNSLAFVGVLDPDGTLMEANAAALMAGGLERDDVIGHKFWQTYWWSHDPGVVARLKNSVQRARRGELVRYDEVVRMRGDTMMTIDFMLSPILAEDGTATHLVASGYDITAREKAAAHVQLLMREINHRSKNVLTLVQSVARLIKRANPQNFIESFDSRLRSIAASYDLLVNDGWDGVDLGDLAHTQLAHFQDLIGTRIHISGPPARITASAAQALGMAFHELATNAGKYGALSNDTGTVRLNWTIGDGQPGDQALTVTWVEKGGPPVTEPQTRGFGSTVLGSMAENALDADVEIAFPPDGLTWVVRCADDCIVR